MVLNCLEYPCPILGLLSNHKKKAIQRFQNKYLKRNTRQNIEDRDLNTKKSFTKNRTSKQLMLDLIAV